MKPSDPIFAGLASTIIEISSISGIPGVAVGVLNNSKVVHEASYGYCDVANQTPCDSNSTFVLGSLTKAFTVALLSQLVDEGKVQWNDHVSQILPSFKRPSPEFSKEATLADLLCHRTGLSRYDALWEGSGNMPFLRPADAVDILRYVPQELPFRASFLYNNYAFEVLGQVIEKISGARYASLLHDRLLRPLGMNRTYYTNVASDLDNQSKSYYALTNASVAEISQALQGDNVLMGPAGGIRSCVSDLLIFYDAWMQASTKEMSNAVAPEVPAQEQATPLRKVSDIWTGWNVIPMSLLTENSYGFGWVRSQLPSALTPTRGDPQTSPLVGVSVPSRLALWHSGSLPGYRTYVTLLPQTHQAVVVLTNSAPLNEGGQYISNLLVEALLDNLDNVPDYKELAKITAKRGADKMVTIEKEIERGRTHAKPIRSLDAYAGRYYNAVGNFFIDIEFTEGDDDLWVSFMGRKLDTFRLHTYQDDSFSWFLSHDASARLGRNDGFGRDFYILRFGDEDSEANAMKTLWWRHESTLPEKGEAFGRKNTEHYLQVQS